MRLFELRKSRFDVRLSLCSDAEVKKTCMSMIADHWFQAGDKSLFDILELLDVEQYEDAAELLVRAVVARAAAPPPLPRIALLDDASSEAPSAGNDDDNNNEDAPSQALSPVVALYWRVRCQVKANKNSPYQVSKTSQMAAENNDDAQLDSLLPSGAAVCRGVVQCADAPFAQRQVRRQEMLALDRFVLSHFLSSLS